MGVDPDQFPEVAPRDCPCWAVPETVGAPVLDRAVPPVPPPPLDELATVALVLEYAVATPYVFLAMTTTRTVMPTSALWRVYEAVAAPLIDEQLEGELHRCHWYPKLIGVVPAHTPFPARSA
jgi:hypothetical protein